MVNVDFIFYNFRENLKLKIKNKNKKFNERKGKNIMSRTIVTLKDNLLIDENGELSLKDPTIIGHLRKTHPLSAQMIDPNTNQIQFGVTFKAEVFWEHVRSPAPSFEDPEQLAWVNFSDEAEEEIEDAEDEFEEDDEIEYQTV